MIRTKEFRLWFILRSEDFTVKRWIVIALTAMLFLFSTVGCSQPSSTETWQEQYDLGLRYLSEVNYAEAVIAFTKAIEIDPKQAAAFAGRGKAYAGMALAEMKNATGELSETATAAYRSALDDYLQAISLDETNAELYESAASIYLALGDTDAAAAILQQGIDKTKSQGLKRKLDEFLASKAENEVTLTGFAARKGYVAFDNLSVVDQERIKTAITMLESGERESVCEYLGNSAWEENDANQVLYTEYGRYRIKNSHQLHLADFNRVTDTIEIRPEIGQGYLALLA